MDFKERTKKYKKMLPNHPNAEEVFEEAVSKGKTPGVVAATLHYCLTDKNQQKCADKFGVSKQSITNSKELCKFFDESERKDWGSFR